MRRVRQRLASRTIIGAASANAIRARASSASSTDGPSSAARRPREEDHSLCPGRDLAVLPDQRGLAATAARVDRGDRRPHALVELSAELRHEPLLVLANPAVALRQKQLALPGLHAQEADHRAGIMSRVWPRPRRVGPDACRLSHFPPAFPTSSTARPMSWTRLGRTTESRTWWPTTRTGTSR